MPSLSALANIVTSLAFSSIGFSFIPNIKGSILPFKAGGKSIVSSLISIPLALIKASALVDISELTLSFLSKKLTFISPTFADSPNLDASGIAIGVTVLFVKALNVIGVALPV